MTPLGIEWQHNLLALALILPRLLAAFTALPFLSKAVLPGLVRSGLVISLAMILIPMAGTEFSDFSLTVLQVLGIVIKEIFLGLCIGYLIAIPFWAAGTIGFFIDTQRGATMASAFVPLLGDQTSPLGTLFNQLVTLLFMIGGGFLLFLEGLYQSYQVWPLLSFFPRLEQHGTTFFLNQLDTLMYLTVFLAGPLILIMFLVELGLALISRFAPELNVFFVALPIKSGISIFLLIFYTYHLVQFFQTEFTQAGSHFLNLSNLFQ
jgi:type III secretion protein T